VTRGSPSDDAVLRALGVDPLALLGRGGEATVYALDDERVARVLRHPDRAGVQHRRALVAELLTGGAPFALPEILDVGEVDGRVFTIERRLPGRPLRDVLAATDAGAARDELVERYLEAAQALGHLHLRSRGWFGELIGLEGEALRAPAWRGFLAVRAARSLAHAGWVGASPVPARLADGLPDVRNGAFVHLDVCAANVLVDGGAVTAVLDIGPTAVVGDAAMNALTAAVHLAAPEITPAVRPRDVAVARSWLRSTGLDDRFEPARRWLAAYWSFATDDVPLQSWCRSVLGTG
jgi:Ser/Thr protein kinase RdoA (MazF antagonist)